ncbi:hypothetical protein G4X40_14180 [Rhodococcus sp. D2-41]|uniref:Type VII secretion target n=1 Tax=Speluncibacter jeojiensis TaxID=2710754 RepID=A0A9X4M0N3_9ACTN|nr:type VII secretion target [Rhodococcus sp. D2-41]MDG3011300.1 hypothetical protein [Rhodococcus sp. D2-41]MDG3015849.1 type VII secretion target [Corynebacteriales bacterium D3-21]
MSTLKVDPAHLDRFADHLSGLANQSRHAQQYLDEWLNITAGEGRMFVPVVEKIRDIHATLAANCARAAELSGGAGAELSRAATMYRTTDATNAADLDATYQEVAR